MNLNESLLHTLGIEDKWLSSLNETFARFEINTSHRVSGFLGNMIHESGNFKFLEENLHYSPERLCQVFPSRFKSIIDAQACNTPEKIGDAIYGGRMGNSLNEGFKYRGRGLIQLTGKSNYSSFGKFIGKETEILNNPDLLTTPEYASFSAGWFWSSRSLNALSDLQDWKSICYKINGGYLGLEKRIGIINKVYSLLV